MLADPGRRRLWAQLHDEEAADTKDPEMTIDLERANRVRLAEAHRGRAEIQAADAVASPPEWARRSPDLLKLIRNNPEKGLAALAALRAAQDDPEVDQWLITRLIADLEKLI
jgi:hypothetical protein